MVNRYVCQVVGIDKVFIGRDGIPDRWEWIGEPSCSQRLTNTGIDAVNLSPLSSHLKKVVEHAADFLQKE